MSNIFTIAKAIRAKHPRMTVPASVKAASKEMKAAKRKTAVTGVKKKKPAAAKRTTVKRAAPAKKKPVASASVKIGAISKGRALVNNIAKLEALRKKEKNRAMRDIIQRQINKDELSLRKLKSA